MYGLELASIVFGLWTLLYAETQRPLCFKGLCVQKPSSSLGTLSFSVSVAFTIPSGSKYQYNKDSRILYRDLLLLFGPSTQYLRLWTLWDTEAEGVTFRRGSEVSQDASSRIWEKSALLQTQPPKLWYWNHENTMQVSRRTI